MQWKHLLVCDLITIFHDELLHMKNILAFLLVASISASAQGDWKMAQGKITTQWSANVTPENVLPEYPRPQMVRERWNNLNGIWQYAIVPKTNNDAAPSKYDGNILVPFVVESALSGVARTVGKDSVLWYKRTVKTPGAVGRRTLLHFGAVDWQRDPRGSSHRVQHRRIQRMNQRPSFTFEDITVDCLVTASPLEWRIKYVFSCTGPVTRQSTVMSLNVKLGRWFMRMILRC